VSVRFEANYTEGDRGVYAVERWHLQRSAGARSKPPDRMRVFACPNCAAPLTQVDKGMCAHCNTQVATGAFDWLVTNVTMVSREARGPQLTSDVAERGTNLPDVFDPDLQRGLADLSQRDPSFELGRLSARVGLIFAELQVGWSTRDWTRVRPFVSDMLFQTQLYWIQEYTRQKMKNVTENARITRLGVVKVVSDSWYDAITVRLHARSLDYTITDEGKVVSGSRKRERPYSEYWTLLRGRSRAAPTVLEKKCPNCAAELKVNMAGACEYCQARVASGDFDWVLSRIEQDEAYQG
jgi:hypothetical protein